MAVILKLREPEVSNPLLRDFKLPAKSAKKRESQDRVKRSVKPFPALLFFALIRALSGQLPLLGPLRLDLGPFSGKLCQNVSRVSFALEHVPFPGFFALRSFGTAFAITDASRSLAVHPSVCPAPTKHCKTSTHGYNP